MYAPNIPANTVTATRMPRRALAVWVLSRRSDRRVRLAKAQLLLDHIQMFEAVDGFVVSGADTFNSLAQRLLCSHHFVMGRLLFHRMRKFIEVEAVAFAEMAWSCAIGSRLLVTDTIVMQQTAA